MRRQRGGASRRGSAFSPRGAKTGSLQRERGVGTVKQTTPQRKRTVGGNKKNIYYFPYS